MSSAAAVAKSRVPAVTSCSLPVSNGILEMRVYPGVQGREESIAMVARVRHGQYTRLGFESQAAFSGELGSDRAIVMRVHDQCQTSEVFGSVKCDCKQQLERALAVLTARAKHAWCKLHGCKAPAECSGEHASSPATSVGSDATNPDADASAAAGALDPDAIVGVVVYLKQEGRGIGLAAKVAAYALQERADGEFAGYARCHSAAAAHTRVGRAPLSLQVPAAGSAGGEGEGEGGLDTVDANRALGLPDDSRHYGVVVDILRDLSLAHSEGGEDVDAAADGAASSGAGAMPSPPAAVRARAALLTPRPIVLMTNNPRKKEELRRLGVPLAEELMPCRVEPPSPLAAAYMRTKAERMGHFMKAEAKPATVVSAVE